ncbi:Fe-S-binding domain-containing protein, partial [bacterium]
MLTLLAFLPLLGAIIVLLMKKESVGLIRGFTLAVVSLNFLASLPLLFGFDSAQTGMQFVEKMAWIPSIGVDYHVGVDGISLWLVMLTTFLSVICILSSLTVEKKVKEYMFFFLILETGMIGALVSLDLFLFYIFWEAMLIPMYFLIGVWGGKERIYAAVKFFIFTMVGSLLMLVAIIALYYMNIRAGNPASFNILELYKLPIAPSVQMIMFMAFALAFAIKVPMWPVHT